MKKHYLTKTQDLIMTDAVAPYGAASYLFEKELAQLEKQGYIYKVDEHTFKATELGTSVWANVR